LAIADENASVSNGSTTKHELGGTPKTSKTSTISSTELDFQPTKIGPFVTDTTFPVTRSLNKSIRPPVDDGENGIC